MNFFKKMLVVVFMGIASNFCYAMNNQPTSETNLEKLGQIIVDKFSWASAGTCYSGAKLILTQKENPPFGQDLDAIAKIIKDSFGDDFVVFKEGKSLSVIDIQEIEKQEIENQKNSEKQAMRENEFLGTELVSTGIVAAGVIKYPFLQWPLAIGSSLVSRIKSLYLSDKLSPKVNGFCDAILRSVGNGSQIGGVANYCSNYFSSTEQKPKLEYKKLPAPGDENKNWNCDNGMECDAENKNMVVLNSQKEDNNFLQLPAPEDIQGDIQVLNLPSSKKLESLPSSNVTLTLPAPKNKRKVSLLRRVTKNKNSIKKYSMIEKSNIKLYEKKNSNIKQCKTIEKSAFDNNGNLKKNVFFTPKDQYVPCEQNNNCLTNVPVNKNNPTCPVGGSLNSKKNENVSSALMLVNNEKRLVEKQSYPKNESCGINNSTCLVGDSLNGKKNEDVSSALMLVNNEKRLVEKKQLYPKNESCGSNEKPILLPYTKPLYEKRLDSNFVKKSPEAKKRLFSSLEKNPERKKKLQDVLQTTKLDPKKKQEMDIKLREQNQQYLFRKEIEGLKKQKKPANNVDFKKRKIVESPKKIDSIKNELENVNVQIESDFINNKNDKELETVKIRLYDEKGINSNIIQQDDEIEMKDKNSTQINNSGDSWFGLNIRGWFSK